MKFFAAIVVASATLSAAYPSMQKKSPQGTDQSQLPEGEWALAGPNDVRSPCPMLNAMANHGFLNRDGRGITRLQITTQLLSVVGLGFDASFPMATAGLTEIGHLVAGLFDNTPGSFGCRPEGQKFDDGEAYINLDQLNLHGAIEHDISLVRTDYAQGGDYVNPNPDLLQQFYNAATYLGEDGQLYLTVDDTANYRRLRFEQQQAANSQLVWTGREKTTSFGEASIIHGLFGIGTKRRIPVSYLQALFGEHRIPFAEGFQKRIIPVSLAENTARSLYIQHQATK